MPRRTKTPIRIRYHAHERSAQRCDGLKLTAGKLRQHILGALAVGLPVNERGAVEVPIGKGRVAVCVPDILGGWVVVTIVDKGA